MATVWRDGVFIEDEEFRVSPFDRGLCHGLGLFETILAVDGVPKLIDRHLERMRNSFGRLGVESVGLDEAGLETVGRELLSRNDLGDGLARLRFAVSMGEGPLNRTDSGGAWAWMTASRVLPAVRELRVTSAPWKVDQHGFLGGMKTGSYAAHLAGLDLARREGFDEVLFFNTADELCEAAMSNVFVFRKGILWTPGLDSGCLAGVTRALILRLAENSGIKCRVGMIKRSEVAKAEGMFLTSSIVGPVPVTTYQSRNLGLPSEIVKIRGAWLAEMRIGSGWGP